MNRCVIVGGAPIHDYVYARSLLETGDFVIYCDCGLRHRDGLGAAPDMVVGDFDSHANPNLSVETVVLPHEKDDTDSFHAVTTAYERGFREFLLLGVFGGRVDHTLGNMYMLLWLKNRDCRVLASDDYSDFEIAGTEPVYIDSGRYEYFSLIAIDGNADGITIENAKYDLTDGHIDSEFQLGLSNEPLAGQTARVTVTGGCMLVVKDRR